MKNEAKCYWMTVRYAMVTLTGSVLQTFLMELGLSAEMVLVCNFHYTNASDGCHAIISRKDKGGKKHYFAICFYDGVASVDLSFAFVPQFLPACIFGI